ncbi:efflux RND transporter periplasmic adaptor subunit [Parasphingorhabdus litoris]|uniref:Efflux RND transporter periplasmic adaptor subunit n=1 Tax=Parasphingorhabdus litoris TaxID=394733 RepID=A0ABP3KPA6_9SPHN|nr:efflux RND transporter periplasmic adaptor subunit [Parasphingorhabdus litoris]
MIITRSLAWIRLHPVISGFIALVVIALLYKLIVPAAQSYEYVAEPVSRGSVARVVSASGKLRALNTINVGSEISGQVTDVYVDFNSPVTAGQVLARIDPTRIQARVTQARAQVASAQATLAQAEASIIRAQTDFEVQSREFERQKQLADKGFVSKAGIDQARNALANARAALSTARAQAQSGRAQIAQSEAELSSAQLDLNRTRILAPTSGVVINKLVEPGTTVAASFQTPNLFEIAADTSRMQVEASVDEADIGQVRVDQLVRFTVDSYPDDTFVAKVGQIRKSATEEQNVVSYLVILDVDNKEGKLLTGMTANVEIVTGTKTNVLRVPAPAIRFRPRKSDRPDEDKDQQEQSGNSDEEKQKKARTAQIWIAGDDPYEPTRRTVTIGLAGEDFVEIIKGVEEKEKVLVRSRNLENDDDEEEDEFARGNT